MRNSLSCTSYIIKNAISIVKSHSAAEELVHDAYVKILKRIEDIEEPASARTKRYLVITVRNTCYDYLLKFVPALLERKGKEKVAEEKVQVQKPVQQETVPVQNTDNSELIAVIAAAVAAQMSEETGIAVAPDGLVIRSIKKRVFS